MPPDLRALELARTPGVTEPDGEGDQSALDDDEDHSRDPEQEPVEILDATRLRRLGGRGDSAVTRESRPSKGQGERQEA